MVVESAVKLHLAPDPQSPRTARSAIRDRLSGRLPGEKVEDAELLVSELVTNGIRHGKGDIDLEVLVDNDHRVLVRCRDGGQGFRPRRPQPHEDGSGGYGLMLVERLSSRWGVSEDDTSCVWFELKTA